jgi:uncharacterized protein YjiK
MRARLLLLSVAVVLIAVIVVSSMLSNVYAVGVASDVFDFKFGNYGFGDGQFWHPEGVAYDPNNNRIIVADTYNHRIQVFDSNGKFLFKFGGKGSSDGEFRNSRGVAYDPNNNRIIVVDNDNHRIQVFDSNGKFLFKFGNFGSDDGQFYSPHGVTYDHNNNRIIVADTKNHRVQVFSLNYSLTLYEGSNPSDGVINLGEDITAKAITKNNDITSVKFRWIDPSNNVARTNTVNIVSGEASNTFTPNQVGTWKVVAEFSNGTIVVKELQVPFQVFSPEHRLRFPVDNPLKGSYWYHSPCSYGHFPSEGFRGADDTYALDLNWGPSGNSDQGKPVYAIENGVIKQLNRDWGWVLIEHKTPLYWRGQIYDTWYSGYLHMQNIPDDLKEEVPVKKIRPNW